MTDSFELGPIRPPSEAYSLLIRVTKNCPWNRCKFCHIYKGQKFELRPVEEVKRDILAAKAIQDGLKAMAWKSDYGGSVEAVAAAVLQNPPSEAYANIALWLYHGGTSAFLQDANTLVMKTPDLVEIIKFLKKTMPSITQVTSYGRSKTAARKKPEEMKDLHEAGLSRLHIGMESGYDPLLEYMDKGVTAADHIKGGKNIVESGISLCEYVVLGLGGKKMWREHAVETAKVLNQIDPEFIRVRTLTVKEGMPLYEEVQNGSFVRASDEEIVEEERLLIENLDCGAYFVSDHITNLLQELEGRLPDDKDKMLAAIARFQSLSPGERHNFRVGRRVGIYNELDDMKDSQKHTLVERAIEKLSDDGKKVSDEMIYFLMERFI
ncbi:MAG: radical SAM protein [Deltaproteobacteria bacterium]|nr:radical SAM protein [Deltaproteobacteria bacterium]